MSWILKYSLAVGFALKKQNVFVRLWILTILPRINQIEKIMARPIGETPVLYGEDAVRFLKEVENVKPASNEEKDRVVCNCSRSISMH